MARSCCPQCGYDVVQAIAAGLCPVCLLSAGKRCAYTILNLVGRGQNGTVYLAEQPPTRCVVAFKVFDAVSEEGSVVERLRQQAHELAILSLPNVARALDVGLTGDRRPYLVREFVRGAQITTFCERSRIGRAGRQRLLAIVSDVMARAHARGVTHGGITASNVFVLERHGEPPVVTVMDFGVRSASAADDTAALGRLAGALL